MKHNERYNVMNDNEHRRRNGIGGMTKKNFNQKMFEPQTPLILQKNGAVYFPEIQNQNFEAFWVDFSMKC